MRVFTVAAFVLLAACAHRPPSVWSATEHRLCEGALCYRVGALDGTWRVVQREGAAVGFYNDALGGVIESNATCRADSDVAPLETLTRHLLIGYGDRHIQSQQKLVIDRREALRTVVDARLDGVPMILDLFVLKRNGCIFDLSYAAPPDRYQAGRAAFERFVLGFRDERPS